MSTAKMVADSTVSSELLGDRRKRRKSGTNKHNKKTRKNSKDGGRGHNSEDTDSDLDLEKDLKAIGEYIKDRAEMLDNMFSAVRGPSLKRALPDILLDLPLDELKQRCLEQLEIMSKKRIRRILEGANPADISSSGTDDSSGEEKADSLEYESVGTGEEIEEEVEYIEVEEEVEVTDYDEEGSVSKEEDVQVQSGEELDDEIQESEAESDSEGQHASENDSDCEAPSKMITDEEMSDSGTVQEKAADLDNQGQTKVGIAPILTKDQMEILELEMRARAIKAMLNKPRKTQTVDSSGNSDVLIASGDQQSVTKDIHDSIKDMSDPSCTGIDQKLQHASLEEQEVRPDRGTIFPRKSSKQKQFRNFNATTVTNEEAVSEKNYDYSLKEGPVFSRDGGNVGTGKTDKTSHSDVANKLDDAESCQESKETGSIKQEMDEGEEEQAQKTLCGRDQNEAKSCTGNTSHITENLKNIHGKSMSNPMILKEGELGLNSPSSTREVSSALTDVESSDTEEGEVTSEED